MHNDSAQLGVWQQLKFTSLQVHELNLQSTSYEVAFLVPPDRCAGQLLPSVAPAKQ